MSAYLPKLFIRAVGNAHSSEIYHVIEELGFGSVRSVEFRGNNAVVSMVWDIPYTTATRMILQEGVRPLSLYYSDTRFWSVIAYKSREERQRQEKERERKEKERERKEKECQRKEKECQRQKKERERKEKERERKEKERERKEKERQEEEILQMHLQELDRLEIERKMQDLSMESNYSDDIQDSVITMLDYGNVAEFYPVVRTMIRARIGLVA